MFFTIRPARIPQPCRYCFYSLVQKWVFRPAGATRYPDKREIWHGAADRLPFPNYTFIGAEMWEYSPKTVKISNFGHKFTPPRRLVCNIFTIFSAFYMSIGSFQVFSLVAFGGQTIKILAFFRGGGIFPQIFNCP